MTDGYQRHSALRGAERYGLEIDAKEYAALSAKIGFHGATQAADCVKLCPAEAGRVKWAIWYKAEWIPVVFDPAQGRIVTILPPRELRKFRHKLPW